MRVADTALCQSLSSVFNRRVAVEHGHAVCLKKDDTL